MEEDVRSLKTRMLQLTQELQMYQEENARLKARISEYYEWSQQAQQSISSLQGQIETLESEKNQFQQKERQRQDNASEMTFDRLLDENQKLEVEIREVRDVLEKSLSHLFRLFQTTVTTLERSHRDPIADFLWEKGDETSRTFVGILKKGGVGSEQDIARELGVSVSTVRRVSESLERSGTMTKGKEGEILLSKDVRVTSSAVQPEEWETLEVEAIFENASSFFERETDQQRISNALENLRDALAAKIGHSVFLYEIAKEASEWKKTPGQKAWLQRKLESWKEKALSKI